MTAQFAYHIEPARETNRPSFDTFKEAYRRPFGGSLLRRVRGCFPPRKTYLNGEVVTRHSVDWYRLAFELRCRVADRAGFFADVPGAQWCLPWNWARLYYNARFPQ